MPTLRVPISFQAPALRLLNSLNLWSRTVCANDNLPRKIASLTSLFSVRACYGERYPELMDATLLWNERSMRGIPAIAAAEGAGTLESMHMQMDVSLI